MNKRHIHNHGFRQIVAALLMTLMMAGQASAQSTGVKVHGNVYGGGNLANVGQSVTVNVSGGEVDGDVYGGGAKAHTNTGNWNDGTGTFTQTFHAVTIKEGESVEGYFTNAAGTTPATGTAAADGTYYKKTETIVNLTGGEVKQDVYGGGLGYDDADNSKDQPANVYGDVTVTTTDGKARDVFGANNILGTPKGVVVVNINGTAEDGVRNVYGGGNQATYEGNSTTVTMTAGKAVNIYGGGLSADVAGSVTVNIQGGTVTTDVYGGGALGHTNTANWDGAALASTYATIVNLTNGTIGRDVYGGGLGEKAVEDNPATSDVDESYDGIAALVYGDVTVNIGAAPVAPSTTPTGNVSIGGSVFGCNNANGTPKGDVLVNVYKTAHTETETNDQYPSSTQGLELDDSRDVLYALEAVYGGGNEAAYLPVAVAESAHSTTVHVYGCTENTVKKVYGGGNAADVGTTGNSGVAANTNVIIEGGRFYTVFGGGNGYGDDNPGANIYGTATTDIQGGIFNQIFGGSDSKGDVNEVALSIEDNCGTLIVNESFGGANRSNMTGNVTTTLTCSGNMTVNNFYGGSNQANIEGSVTLNVYGGTFTNVFGGSKGVLDDPSTLNVNEAVSADITGDVTLNLYGGTMVNAFGGSNINGSIGGKITVNVLNGGSCGLTVTNIYGAGNVTPYNPTYTLAQNETEHISPVVNIIHGTVENVFGGAKGETAIVTASPQVNIGYDATTMGDLETENTLLYSITRDATNYNTSETIPANFAAVVTGNVYGGGDLAQVAGSTTVNLRKANSSVSTIYGGGNEANVSGNTAVNINAGNVTHDVYGGGALANVGTNASGNTPATTHQVTIAGGTVTGNVYGGGLGRIEVQAVADDPSTDENEAVEGVTAVAALVNGVVTVTINGGTVANVFGCNNENGSPQNGVTVNINNSVTGSVYGGGNLAAYNPTSHSGVYPAVNINNGTIGGDVFGGGLGESAKVYSNPVVTVGDLTEGHESYAAVVTGSVYGGGSAAMVGDDVQATASTNNTTVLVQKANSSVTNVFGGGMAAGVTGATNVTIANGTVSTAVYGGCNTSGTVSGTSTVTVTGGTLGTAFASAPASMGAILQVLFGGGKGAVTSITGLTTLNVGTKSGNTYTGSANIYGNVYGGSENGEVHAVDVNLYGNTIYGNVFGGGFQTAPGKTAATTVNVVLDGTKFDRTYDYTAQIFGANNLQGTPTGHVKVWVKRTVDSSKPSATARTARTTYDVAAVYGGGNEANYNPTDADHEFAEVLIEGCEVTSIENVYGGGNAAAVPATKVTVNGSYIINKVYGGGNGADTSKPGADVGVIDPTAYAANHDNGTYGTGKAETKLNGGYINYVYGGSNTQGDIAGGTDVQTKREDEILPTGSCPELKIGELYGAGSHADVNHDVNIILDCMPEDYVAEVYGGAEQANINGSVTLTVSGGKFGRVFGGNNAGGDIKGSITVNINEGGCKPLEIGEVYGGGNAAPYSIYGCTRSGNIWTANTGGVSNLPDGTTYAVEVNVIACTSVGKVFGGGFGQTAEVIGDTHVFVNLFKGYVGDQEQATIGKIGQIFGGGSAAKVTGNTTVDIGTATSYEDEDIGVNITRGTYTNATDGTYISPTVNEYIDIEEAGVYGGGLSAEVDGNTTVNIGTANQSLGTWIDGNIYGGGKEGDVTGNTQVNICAIKNNDNTYSSATLSNAGVTITGNVFGAGQGVASDITKALVSGNSTLVMAKGEVKKSIYGGGETSQVAGNTDVKVIDGTIGTANQAGAVYGNVYGGGLGSDGTGDQSVIDKVKAGLVKGNTTVSISGGTILHNIYGGGAYGSVGTFNYDNSTTMPTGLATANTGKATITITGGTIGTNGDENGMVFGSSRGDVSAPNAIHDKLAWVYDTEVNIGTNTGTNESPNYVGSATINGSVYGGGENGHNYNDAVVNIYRGTIGIANGSDITDNKGTPNDPLDDITYSGAEYPYRGNVYGAGCGTDKYKYDSDNNGTLDAEAFNPLAGVVQGNATVTMKGGTVVHNIYGAGAMGSVGTITNNGVTGGETTINISGGTVGVSGTVGDGNVFGAARGNAAATSNEYALVLDHTSVNISGGTVYGNVYGGGELGCVGRYVISTDMRNFYWTNTPLDDIDPDVPSSYTYNNTGVCNVNITGSTASIKGHVFGGGKGKEDTFWCEKGIVYKTNVTITNGTVDNNVYGGGQVGRVETDATVKIGPDSGTGSPEIKGDVFGAGAGVETHGYSALVRGNTYVTVQSGAKIHENVYGGGELAAVGKYYLNDAGMPYSLVNENLGVCNVTVKGGAEIGYNGTGHVFGGGKGKVPTYYLGNVETLSDTTRMPKRMMSYNNQLYTNDNKALWGYSDASHLYVWEYFNTRAKYHTFLETLALATRTVVSIEGSAKVNGSVYGGSESGFVQHNTSVTIKESCTIGKNTSGTVTGGDVYGGGLGLEIFDDAGRVSGTTTVNIDGGTINRNVYGGGAYGAVKKDVTVNVTGGIVTNDVYGGGALANTNTDNWDAEGYEAVSGLTAGTSVVTGLYTESGGNYTLIETENQTAAGSTTYYQKGTWATSMNNASTGTTYKTAVNLTGGIIGNGYGGGLGDATHPAYVYGDVAVTVAGVASRADNGRYIEFKDENNVDQREWVPYSGRIFGANNVNGTPKGNIKVLINSTKLTTDGITTVNTHTIDSWELHSVYGGGNLANYLPADGKNTEVEINGCDDTSIQYVYGGGNSASVPQTKVTINSCFQIGYVFGGGNGFDPVQNNEGKWVPNPGADVKRVGGVSGTGQIIAKGGTIGWIYGGSNKKGICGHIDEEINQVGDCPLRVTHVYGAGKNADIDGSVNIVIKCPGNNVDYVYGGSLDARIGGDVTMTIIGGQIKNVFGGNDAGGSIGGKITVNVQETHSCQPVIIENLYGGGNLADYPNTNSNTDPKITVNVKSCTWIGNLYGGGKGNELRTRGIVTGDTEVNINLVKGYFADPAHNTFVLYKDDMTGTVADIKAAIESMIPNITVNSVNTTAKTASCTVKNEIGTISYVYGGGDAAAVHGNTFVNIGNMTTVPIMKHDGNGVPLNAQDLPIYNHETGKPFDDGRSTEIAYNTETVLGANILKDVYGGGNKAEVTLDTHVNICYNGSGKVNEGSAGVKIGNSVYGGGCEADVKGNTFVAMSGGYVFNGIFGGGYSGSVGTFTRRDAAEYTNVYGHTPHTGCSGKPVSCAANTGKCTVVVNGGQIGPVDVAVDGMNAAGGPNPHGWVWGGGCGLIENPSDNPDTHFQTYVGSTDVTIGGDAFIMESIIGGGEFGRVLYDTKVTITGDCQIGVGNEQYNKDGNNNPTTPKRYTAQQWTAAANAVTSGNASAINTAAGNMPECSHFPYQSPYLPYDPYYDTYTSYVASHTDLGPASTSSPSDGKTWIGCVFGGGSGYMPYEIKENGTKVGYDWCRSAGWVEGNTEVIITGGHILTNVYGGNEYTDVKGKCTVKMSGGTIGVPRTLAQIAAHPLTCYLFGAGKGDQRSHFYNYTNVGSVEVEVSGGIIYGSVFGGSEDGHVIGDVKVDIKPGAIIGTWGTSYVDGNVFGGGRGFSGEELTAGAVGGKVDINITGGTILGSIYGGGRLGSVGMDLSLNANGTKTSNFGKMKTTGTDGDITIDISGGTIGNKHEFAYTPTAANVPKTLLEESSKLMHTKGGNVYAGGMGRRTKLDDVTVITDWQKLGNVKSTKLMISGTPWIKGNVYGGGEFGAVTGSRQVMDGETAVTDENNQNINAGTQIFISGGIIGTVMGSTINSGTSDWTPSNDVRENNAADDTRYAFGSVYGGGYGTEVEATTLETDVNKFGAFVTGNTYVQVSGSGTKVRASVYGGGEMACVGGNTYVNVSNGEIGVGEVRAATTASGEKDYVLFGSWKMGNVYGAGKGSTNAVYSGIVKGNSFVDISGGSIYHNVYGGGAYGSVGTFTPTSAVPSAWTANTGKATVKITGGTIGINGWDNGMVSGSGRGDVSAAAFSDPYDKLAWVYDTDVKIGTSGSNTGPSIKGSVYGGGENGHNYHNADVNIYSGTIGISKSDNEWGSMNIGSRGNVYGAGCGTDTYTYTENQGQANQKTFQRHNAIAGLVRGNATVTVSGGRVYNSVYGGGSMGSVGTITNFENLDASYKHSTESTDGKGTLYGFGLSWPYELQYADNTGLATVTVKGSAEIGEIVSNVVYGGYVFGAPKGKVDVGTDDITEQRYLEAKLANVKNAVVNIGTSETSGNDPKIHHSVYGGGEDGHVYENASVTVYHGTIDRSVFGGGKGEGQFTTTLRKATGTDQNPTYDDLSNQVAYSWTAGRVYGNTTVTMNGGNVGYFVYGGGNLGSVGKGNYAGGHDDYSTVGYGELPSVDGNLWTSTSSTDMAYHFLHSGTSTVNILGGTVGTVPGADNSGIPYGSIFGGSRGKAAASCRRSPRYKYVPDFFLGYVNKTIVNIGGASANALSSNSPIIHGSVYGGGQDGHVRNSAEVHVYKGSVEGQANDSFGRSGHVFGAGSGIGTYDTGRVDAQGNPIMAVNNSSGSVTCTSLVEVNGSDAYIAGNVYGGGALASVGPPKTGGVNQTLDEKNTSSGDWKSYSYSQVNINAGTIGGNVYAASRGAGDSYLATNPYFDTDDGSYDPTKYATDIWSNVNVSGGKIGYDSNGNDVATGGSVYGGGETGLVKCGVNVNITGGEIAKDVYGGGALANTQTSNSETVKNTTNVYLNGGLIHGDAYGGGLGRRESGTSGNPGYIAPIPATVFGDINVYLGGNATEASASATAFNITYYTDAHSNVVKSGRVFGCNNLNGSPQGDVTVTVWKTVAGKLNGVANARTLEAKKFLKEGETGYEPHTYEVAAVYGGGNLAAYSPTAAGKKASVIIKTCDVSVQEVYGGGNAAAVPQTDVLINGAYEIESVFGGGNGEDPYTLDGGEHWEVNQGADVNGNATTLLKGGYIHEAYGGSNSKGIISGDVSIDKSSGGACTLIVNDIYGAGKNADVEGDLILVMGCSESRTENVYGCSKNANVKGNVELTITSGEYGKVFGGNNESGSIFGHIIVNIEETGCTPIIIDELYGCGNDATYSVYGYYQAKQYTDASNNLFLDIDKTIPLYKDGSDNLFKDARMTIPLFKDDNDLLYIDQDKIRPLYMPRKSAGDHNTIVTFADLNSHTVPDATTHQYDDPQVNIYSCTRIGKVFGGGLGSNAIVYGNPKVNINMMPGSHATDGKLGQVGCGYTANSESVEGGVFGGGNEARVEGNATVNIGNLVGEQVDIAILDNSGNPVKDSDGKYTYTKSAATTVTGANVTGNVYGGGNLADVGKTHLGTDNEGKTIDVIDLASNTYVNIGANMQLELDDQDQPTGAYTYTPVAVGTSGVNIAGNVFGGGKGEATTSKVDGAFRCGKAMVTGGTNVHIGNGTVGTLDSNNKLVEGTGNVYGGGEVGRVEVNTVVTIGMEGANENTSNPTIRGSVFGAGKGVATHGYSALVRGNSTVTIQGFAKVGESVYGGGEIASVGKYNINAAGLPESLANQGSGYCTVIVRDDAEIGPNNMTMFHVDGSGNIVPDDEPDNSGHVFGAGKGAMPVADYKTARHMTNGNTMAGFASEADYLKFIESLGLATQTEVTIGGNAFVKGDVFGGAEQGFVQHNTHVIIQDDCQIGNGYVQMDADGGYLARTDRYSLNRRYTATEWSNGHLENVAGYDNSLPECASWEYASPYAPHDEFADKYESKGGALVATNGSTFYGNVFGGGSGYFSYAPGKWHWKAGDVGGNTIVEIKGGHVLTNVYGGNELTNVAGTSTVTMSGGTIGVPRTLGQIAAHPVTCYLFGGGKGDPRVLFNKQTNIQDAIVNITGGWIYGSVFGGGEDGHVMRDVTMSISDNAKIGTWGTSYVDGNVFGGGRGFAGDAYTAGNVAGSVTMNISGGTMLGSIYGGGRLGSVGYGLYDAETDGNPTPGYGEMRDDTKYDDGTNGSTFFTKGRGHVEVTIKGGTIGNSHEFIMPNKTNITAVNTALSKSLNTDFTKWSSDDWKTWKSYFNVPNTEYDTSNGRVLHTKGGNVYAGGMGRYVQLDGSTPISTYDASGNLTSDIEWKKLGNVKSTTLTISGTPWIMGNVYGGGEMGAVTPYTSGETVQGGTTSISIEGGTIGTEVTGTTPVKTTVPTTTERSAVQYTYGSVYGGGMGMENHDAQERHGGEVSGNTTVTMSGADTEVRASVFGGGEMAVVDGDTNVTIENGKIGRNEVKPLIDSADAGYVLFGGATMGNVYGGGKGHKDHTEAGLVKGNTNVTISGGNVYHMVYGGGALGSVGTFTVSTGTGEEAYVPAGIPLHWTSGGMATVNITGGVIGISGRDNGLVFGSSRGDLTKPVDGLDPYDRVAWVNKSVVNVGKARSEFNSDDEYNTYMASNTPHIKCSVYGGGENGHNNESATVNVYSGTIGIVDTSDPYYDFDENETVTAKARPNRGNVYGAGSGSDTYKVDNKEYYNPKSGMVAGNTFVNIYGGLVGRAVYGGGAMASIGTENNSGSITAGTGTTTVTIRGGQIGPDNNTDPTFGNVFGAARGNENATQTGLALVKTTDVTISGTAAVKGNVYGGGEIGDVQGNTAVTMQGGIVAMNVFGGGKGLTTFTEAGKVKENTTVNILGGTIWRDVYGGGALGKSNTAVDNGSYPTAMVNLLGGIIKGDAYGGGLGDKATNTAADVGNTVVNLNGMDKSYYDAADPTMQAVFDGLVNTEGATTYPLKTSLKGCIVDEVFGANNVKGTPLGHVKVHVFATQNKDAAKTTITAKFANDNINLTNITVSELKGMLADLIREATVIKIETDTYQATYNNGSATADDVKTAINGLNEAIKSEISDENTPTADIAALNALIYDVKAVYGGGNQADYLPISTNEYAEVIIDGCSLTSIENVYGGGNAAATPATEVKINGCYMIDNVFGGGNGTVKAADVGYNDLGEDEDDTDDYITKGTAKTNLSGGYIHKVFGGSNTSGNILKGSSITSEKTSAESCDLKVSEVFGGGNEAPMDGDTEVVLGCMPGDWIDEIYAGAQNGDVKGDVMLTITSGKFGRVFGGNKSSGKLDGGIVVNIEENPTCETPIVIGELYGGGNEAPYSAYGYDSGGNLLDKDHKAHDAYPVVVHAKAFTSIGKIFGGGKGAAATLIGNPWVLVDEVAGGKTFVSDDAAVTQEDGTLLKTLNDGTDVTLYPRAGTGTMGVVGTIFGGGNEASVQGNTTVKIASYEYVVFWSAPELEDVRGFYTRSGAGTPESPYEYKLVEDKGVKVPPNLGTLYYKKVQGADIRGNIYGGGNNAEVTGDTNVVIGRKAE